MFIPWNHPSVTLTGRWSRGEDSHTSTTNNGSRVEFAFTGSLATLHFDLSTNTDPAPRLWVSVDGGAMVDVTVNPFVKINAGDEGAHIGKAIVKASSEAQARWFAPQEAVVRFVGIEADGSADLPEDSRKIIEFVGDSITEGVLIDPDHGNPENFQDRVFADDSCATYAWLTATKLGMRPRIIGYGGVGTTKSGSGDVPPVQISYPQVYDGCEAQEESADVIVINHGSNDAGAPDEAFTEGYTKLLEVIRSMNKTSRIFAISPFYGGKEEVLPKIVDAFNAANSDDITFISTKGWLPPDPIHPLRDGHQRASELLTDALAHELACQRPSA